MTTPPAPPILPRDPASDPAGPQAPGPSPDPTRTGALWLGATGVVLLLAAAAALVAIRWDDIGQTAKLASMVAITMGLVAGGRRLTESLPVTGNVLFHLGALLIPFDMAAVSVLADHDWPLSVLLTGLTGVGAWYGLARVEPESKVLIWAARLAVVVAAVGIGAVSSVSAALVVAIAAVAASAGLDRRATIPWLGVAAAAPLASRAEWPPRLAELATEIGLGASDRWQLLAAGVIATAVAGWKTRQRPSLEMVAVTVAAAAATLLGVGLNFTAPALGHLVAAGAFVALEIGALAVRGRLASDTDSRLHDAMLFAETIALLFGLGLVIDLSFASVVQVRSALAVALAASGFLHVLGWLIADRRRIAEPVDWLVAAIYGGDRLITTVAVPALVAYSTSVIAGSTTQAAVLVALALWQVATLRTFGHWVAGLCVLAAVVVAPAGWTTVVVGVVATAMMIWATDLRYRDGDPNSAYGTTVIAAVMWTAAVDAAQGSVSDWAEVAVWVLGLGAMAAVVDPRRDRLTLARLVPFVPIALGLAIVASGVMTDGEATAGLALAIVGGAVAGAHAWWRSGQAAAVRPGVFERFEVPALGWLAGFAAGASVLQAVTMTEWDHPNIGTGFAAVGLALAAVALTTRDLTRWTLFGTVTVVSIGGLAAAIGQTEVLAVTTIVVGATITLIGVVARSWMTMSVGWLVVCSGIWLYLAEVEVNWIEAYLVAPVAGALVLGSRFHRTGTSSWLAFAPSIAALAGLALIERLDGGPAWHSVIAAGVGVAAVVVGAYRRLVAPLVVGTVAALAVTAYELVGPAKLVPTWGWLALGGSVLVAAAVVLERSATSPLERGSDLVQVLESNFS